MDNLISSTAALLPLIIANIPNSSGDQSIVLWWILGLAGTAVLFNQLATAWKTILGNLHRESALSPDALQRIAICEKENFRNEQKLEHSLREINQTIESLRHEFKKDNAGIHDKINRIGERVGEVSGELKRIFPK